MTQELNISAGQIIHRLLSKQDQITAIKLATIQSASAYDESEASSIEEESELEKKARFLSKRIGLPFWDSVFLAALKNGCSIDGIAEKALRHNKRSIMSTIKAKNSSEWNIDTICQFSGGKYIMVLSDVECADGIVRHIPMLDFHCPANTENLASVKAILHAMGQSGYLLESGKSYHFYADNLIGAERMMEFLGRALLYAPFIDRAWIAHQMMEGSCALRVSGKPGSKVPPRMIARIACNVK